MISIEVVYLQWLLVSFFLFKKRNPGDIGDIGDILILPGT